MYNQKALHNLIKNLDLSREKAELLGSRVKQRNPLDPSVRIIVISNFQHFSNNNKNNLCYCHDADSLMQQLCKSYSYQQDYWRFFIDSRKNTLKAVLVHNKNLPPPSTPRVTIAHSTKQQI